jgi:hypothetical protein
MKNLGKREIILLLIGLVIGVTFCAIIILILIPAISRSVSGWGNSEIMAAITLGGAIVVLFVPWIEVGIRKWQGQTLYQIDIKVMNLDHNMVRFSAVIENVGDKRIETQISCLYIDQGALVPLVNDRDPSESHTVWFQFPFILEHKEEIKGRPDCVLCKKCFREKNPNYPEEIVTQDFKAKGNLLRAHIPLDHLSYKSIKYINPKEKFSEDVILQFKDSGVYRVTFFVGTEGTADCECATKQFYVAESLQTLSSTSMAIIESTQPGSTQPRNGQAYIRQKGKKA